MLAWRWVSLCAAAANAFVVPAVPRRPTLRSPPAAAVADYSFMLPASTAVATCCQLCGIGGAALFSPIFLLVFPYLGPEYPLDSPAAAIASALLTEVFGFASGLTGYARRGLVSWPVAAQFASVTVPCAFIGALAVGSLAADPALLRGTYALLMLSLAAYLTFTPSMSEKEAIAEGECEIPPEDDAIELTSHPALADGRVLTFRAPPKGSVASASVSGAGGLLTGLLGVGVGETLLPQLLRGCCMPLPLAAGTSVATVVATAAAAAAVQFSELASASGDEIASVVPWSLVCYTIPGVVTTAMDTL